MQTRSLGVGMLVSLLVLGAALANSVFDDFETASPGPLPGQSSGGSTGAGSWMAAWAGNEFSVVENNPAMASQGNQYVHSSGSPTFFIRDFLLDPVTSHSQDVKMVGIDFERVFMMSSVGAARRIQAEVYFVGASPVMTENGMPPGPDGTMWVFNGDGSGGGHGLGTWQQLGEWKGAGATGGFDASQRYVNLEFADIRQGVEGGSPGTYDIVWGNVVVANDVAMLQAEHNLTSPNFHIVPGAGDSYTDNIRVIPEPAALALLAVGGIFLRRRR